MVEKINSRFFAFGCSFTSYAWPTWADIIGKEFEIYENWGRVGAGNCFIFNSLVECDLRNTLTPQDTVVIMWTNVTRDDLYTDEWVLLGNRYNRSPNMLTQSIRGYYIRDLALIYAAKKLLDSIGCRYIFTSMVSLLNPNQVSLEQSKDNIDDLVELYQPLLNHIRPSVHEAVFNNNWNSRKFRENTQPFRKKYEEVAGEDWPSFDDFMLKKFDNVRSDIIKEIIDEDRWHWQKFLQATYRVDSHPTPSEHLEYIDLILPEFKISKNTRSWVEQIDMMLREHYNFTDFWEPVKLNRW
jgi:hypothetical protein